MEETTFPSKKRAHGTLTHGTPEKLYCERKQASFLPKLAQAVRWKRDFLQIRSRLTRRVTGGHPSERSVGLDKLLPSTVDMFSNLLGLSTMSHFFFFSFFFLNYNSAFPHDQQTYYIEISLREHFNSFKAHNQPTSVFVFKVQKETFKYSLCSQGF